MGIRSNCGGCPCQQCPAKIGGGDDCDGDHCDPGEQRYSDAGVPMHPDMLDDADDWEDCD